MRVILRNPHASEGADYRYSLTVGREYEVLGLSGEYYRLLNDRNEPILYEAQCFHVSDPAEPSFWVSTVDDGDRYAEPPGWDRPGYFVDWHDAVATVLADFWAQLPHWYPWTAERLSRRERK